MTAPAMTAATNGAPRGFDPPPLLRSPHVQTLIGSRGRNRWVRRRAEPLMACSETRILTTPEGVRLEASSSLRKQAATVILIHGWLGHTDSSYVLSAAAEFWAQGFSVIRLNLRDHGETAHLNEEMFHSARTREVVDAVNALQREIASGPCGLVGFSLGGNFVLRVARATGLPAVAVCPAMDPAHTMHAIDNGWLGYRWFFVRKWHHALKAKQAAFPDRYDFSDALRLNTVAAMTDLFVRDHTPYSNTDDYLARYTLTGAALTGTKATIVYAEDDPVIPKRGFAGLPDSLDLVPLARGGHCAFVTHPKRPSWVDHFTVQRLATDLGLDLAPRDEAQPQSTLLPVGSTPRHRRQRP
jgi:predicted alpha/beta-fold hydrolase